MKYEYLSTDKALGEFISQIADAPLIAFDTEFVSEDRYFPDLCLVQVSALGKSAINDPLTVSDLRPFWHMLSAPGHVTIVHAGREEFRFCRRAIGERPTNWFDTQLASGLVGIDYPAGLNLMINLTGEGRETVVFDMTRKMMVSKVSESKMDGAAIDDEMGVEAPMYHTFKSVSEVEFE